MYDAFVLAAGFGTRLQPLTHHLPKPLTPVCGVPLLAYSLAGAASTGLTKVVVNAHHLAETLAAWEGDREGVRVALSVEQPDILGTGGGLQKVASKLNKRFVVLNGDVLHDVALSALLAAVPEGGGALALRAHADAARYGVVAADATGTVVRLSSVARAEAVGAVDESTHFTGIHAMDREALRRIPAEGFACVVRTAYAALVPARMVAGLRHHGLWLDIGDVPAYLEANLALLRGVLGAPIEPMARASFGRRGGRPWGDARVVEKAEVEGDLWVGEGAEIGRARLCDSVVGEGALVETGATLREVVVWAGTRVPAGDWRRGVWGPFGFVQV